MNTVVKVLTVPATRDVPDMGRMTQDTAAMDRRGLYPHSPRYIWVYCPGGRNARGKRQPMLAPMVHMQNRRGEYRATARLMRHEDSRQLTA